jgi:hypothetical protein
MNSSIYDFKYKKIENFLTKEEVSLLRTYTQIKHRLNNHSFDFNQNDNGDTYFYGDPLMESLMINKLELMQKETGLKLLPTYAFWRMYTINADLKKHKDRASCEISVTVMIGSDGTKWPIFMKDSEIELLPGDAVVYLGCELEHWREEFKGDWHAQTFLHYVNAEGEFRNFVLDNRKLFGTEK